MTAASVTRLTPSTGLAPAKGTLNVAASVLLIKGTMASMNASGEADIVHNAQPIIGILTQTYDNQTGLAGALVAQVEFGVFELALSGSAPKPGTVMFAVDNQTVSSSSSGGTRGVAGYFIKQDTSGKAFVYIAPQVSGSYADVSAVTSTANKAGADALTLAVTERDISLGSAVVATTGAQVGAFSNGVSDGLAVVDSEALAIRINDGNTPVYAFSVGLPADFDATKALTLRILAGRVGSTDTTVALTPHVFRNRPGAAHDAGSDLVTGNTAAISGATKVVTALSKAIDQNGGAAAGDNLYITLTNTTLTADDLLIYRVWISFTRTVTS